MGIEMSSVCERGQLIGFGMQRVRYCEVTRDSWQTMRSVDNETIDLDSMERCVSRQYKGDIIARNNCVVAEGVRSDDLRMRSLCYFKFAYVATCKLSNRYFDLFCRRTLFDDQKISHFLCEILLETVSECSKYLLRF